MGVDVAGVGVAGNLSDGTWNQVTSFMIYNNNSNNNRNLITAQQ